MASFEEVVTARRQHVRDAARAEQAAAGQTYPAGGRLDPQTVEVLHLVDDPRAPSPHDRELRPLLGTLGREWLAHVRAVAFAEVDTVRCWRCGGPVGYCEIAGIGFRWLACALVVDKHGDGPFSVQCEGCAPVTELGPWPSEAPSHDRLDRCWIAENVELHVFPAGSASGASCQCARRRKGGADHG